MVFQDGVRHYQRLRPDRLRQPDRGWRHAVDGRHLPRPRRLRRHDRLEPLVRVRHALRPVRALRARRDPARGLAGAIRCAPTRPAARSAASRSGGICAFTAAWQRPDQFHKVLSHVGSFTNIASGPTLREGGHNYPFLIRQGAAQADPRLPAGRRERPEQRQPATGGWPTSRWTTPCASPATTTRSSPARASTASPTAARCSPTRCAGSGVASSRLRPPLLRTPPLHPVALPAPKTRP